MTEVLFWLIVASYGGLGVLYVRSRAVTCRRRLTAERDHWLQVALGGPAVERETARIIAVALGDVIDHGHQIEGHTDATT